MSQALSAVKPIDSSVLDRLKAVVGPGGYIYYSDNGTTSVIPRGIYRLHDDVVRLRVLGEPEPRQIDRPDDLIGHHVDYGHAGRRLVGHVQVGTVSRFECRSDPGRACARRRTEPGSKERYADQKRVDQETGRPSRRFSTNSPSFMLVTTITPLSK